MGQNHCAFAGVLERGKDVQQEGIVTILLWRDTKAEALKLIFSRIEAVAPGFGGERWVGDNEVKTLELAFERAVGFGEVRCREAVVLPYGGRLAAVQDHVHLGQGAGGVVHFLAVDAQVEVGGVLGLVMGFQQQRARAAGRVINSLGAVGGCANADDLSHNPRDFCRGVELPLALARLGGEVAHQVFVSIAEDVVPLSAVAFEVEAGGIENADQVGQPIHHLFAFAKLLGIVEVGHINHAGQAVGLGKGANDDVELVANLLVAFERDHVGKATTDRHLKHGAVVASVLVGYVLHEQQHQDVILVL